MFLFRIIPTTRILLPGQQTLTYFSARKLPIGSLVSIPIAKRKAVGVIVEIKELSSQKMVLRQADFELKGILKVISSEKVLTEKQIELAEWISDYYYCPLGPVAKMMIPAKMQNAKRKVQSDNAKLKSNGTQQTLILVPEISMVQKLTEEHKSQNTATLHSKLTDKQYLENWHKVRNGEAEIIIGTRLALFAPFVNLREIIIENEHSANYKSQKAPRLDARETARELARLWKADIIFKNPIPSIETTWLADNNKIKLQVSSYKLQVTSLIVDLRQELKDGNFSIFSRNLQEKIKSALAKKQQIILFINRRGSSTVLMCRDCGYIPKCSNCEVPLVYHLSPIQFICHHCGHSEFPPVLCPNCLGTRIKFFGTGTQKVETEFKKLFPEARVARLDSDIIKKYQSREGLTSNRRPDLQNIEQQIINDFNTKHAQVLIGTQMILNKNLKPAPLVALILADTLLHLPDFRSNERTFQLISRLKNLSTKEFILQTYSPENPAIQFAIADNYKSFYQKEIQARKELSYPPFSQLIKLVHQHKSAKKTEESAKILAEKLKQQIKSINKNLRSNSLLPISILGPSPAFISKVKGKYIWQIILKSKIADIKLRNKILQIIPPDWIIDVDPLQII